MRNPTSEQVQKVIDNLVSVLPLTFNKKGAVRKGHLDMAEGDVKNMCGDEEIHTCGTTHCHGGWYAVAACDTTRNYVDYMHGADKMARDLGFRNSGDLERWADTTRDIWGNESGYDMFDAYGEMAFYDKTCRPKGAKKLSDIIDHWRGVKKRLEELENNK